MNTLILSGTPKSEGLCVSLVEAAASAAREASAHCDVEALSSYKLGVCAMCNDGWGTCNKEHACAYGDDGFSALQKKMAGADCVIFITPVYWGEVSEAMKGFIDRLRRCEATKRFQGHTPSLDGKRCLLVASAGGSGNGILTALEQMERAVRHMNGTVHDYIGVNRWNQEYKREALREAVKGMMVCH